MMEKMVMEKVIVERHFEEKWHRYHLETLYMSSNSILGNFGVSTCMVLVRMIEERSQKKGVLVQGDKLTTLIVRSMRWICCLH